MIPSTQPPRKAVWRAILDGRAFPENQDNFRPRFWPRQRGSIRKTPCARGAAQGFPAAGYPQVFHAERADQAGLSHPAFQRGFEHWSNPPRREFGRAILDRSRAAEI